VEANARAEKSVEVNAKTVDEAINRALALLGVPREQTKIQVLREGSRGILGFGAEDARVRVTVLLPAAPAVAPPAEPAAPPVQPGPAAAAVPAADDIVAVARPLLEGLLKAMGLVARVETRVETDPDDPTLPVVIFNILGDDLGGLIGRRGETLSALQYLTRLMVNKQIERRASIVLDVEGYRQRRERQLRDLAKRMADRVARDGRTAVLEPMPAHERRIVHLALRDHPAVTTYSVGDGDRRKVTIRLKR
jgi:spoIIIJ-associated protein